MDSSRDPRQRPAMKRPASRSPEGSIVQKRPAPAPSSKLSSTSARNNSAATATTAPVAPMNPARNGDSGDGSSALATVTDFFDIAADNADLRRQRREAEIELARANKEYESTQKLFAAYPAIREQKTQLRDRARDRLRRIEQQTQQRAPQVNQVLNALASLISRPAVAPTPTSDPDLELRKEVTTMRGQIQGLEKAVQPKAIQADLTELRSTVTTQGINLQNFEERIDPLCTASQTDIAKLQSASTAQDNEIEDLENRIGTLSAASDARNYKPLDVDATLRNEVTSLKEQLGSLGKAILSRATTTDCTELKSDITTQSRKIQDLESGIDALKTAPQAQPKPIAAVPKDIEDRIEDIEASNDRMVENVTDILATHLKQFEKDFKKESETSISDAISELRSAVDDKLARLQEAQEQLKQTQDGTVDRLSKLEDADTSNTDTSKTDSELSELKEQLSGIQERVQSVEKEAASAPVPGLLSFQPVVPQNFEDDIPQTAQQALGRLSGDVEMLKGVTSQHTRRIDNLTTDEVVRQMVDEMGRMYPAPKDFQQTVNAIRNEMSIIKDQMLRLENSMRALQSDSNPTGVARLRADIDTLKQRVSQQDEAVKQHDEAVNYGKTQFLEIAGNVKALQEDAIKLHSAVSKIGDHPK